ncbi:hypothetical protein H072_6325 [Dactylellina haptotyla CBS 200.50]|uniref:Alpha/beta hydrolase fold-3 domain-containing protein n=1 Tax=Dactylellina haptotyla (strain CBS 200.50) TaxID=1284197 RepID=S8BKK8_DACHA|nr:hypothetical protein H072_6325 [Dactylellina haptotyla CBS 200.50]
MYYIPSEHGTHQIRCIVFEPRYGPSSPSKTKPRPLHFTVHGGAFLPAVAEQNADIAHRICNETGAVVVSVQYRGAPRYAYPAAHDDVDDALAYFLTPTAVGKFNLDPNNITISGLSAGVNLGLSAAQKYPGKIKAAVSWCGAVDLRLPPWEKPKPAGFPKSDPLAFMLPLFDAYVAAEREKYKNDPRLHVILASVDKLPTDMLFLIPMVDILLHEETEFVNRLKKETEGTDRRIEGVFYEGELHGFPELAGIVSDFKKAEDSFQRAIKFLKGSNEKGGWKWDS